MIVNFKNKIFKLHISGLWVARDGEMYAPQSGTHPARFTYGSKCSNGYFRIQLNGVRYLVHRLVADCWIPNPDPDNLITVDHINQVRDDNRVENLRWADWSTQNQNQKHHKNDGKSKPVNQYTLDGQLVNVWPSTAECGRNGFDPSNVAKCCRGERKTYKGFIWSYEPL